MKFLITPLDDISWVSHGFFTRHGDAATAAQALDANIVMVKQVHSATAVPVTGSWEGSPPEADAMVTSEKNIGLAIVTADCAPVLFAARKEKVVGAAHAGWKGALYGVLESTIAEMKKLGATDIEAAIGPCIAPQSYEVSGGFEKPFIEKDPASAKFFTLAKKEGHLMFDLPGYTTWRLEKAGVSTVHQTAQDTLSNEADFCSYRRSTLRGEPTYGRQLSVISIK